MEKSETKPPDSIGKEKSQYSIVSLIIAFLLGIALIVFLQFVVKDITKFLYGEPPKTPDFYQSGQRAWIYKGVQYENAGEAREVFEKAELLPYQTRVLLVSTFINVPLFLLAITLILSLGKLKPSYKLTTTTFFLAMVVNMFTLLKDLAIYIYKINERLAIYGVSLFLIIVFTGSIIYVQDRIRAKEPASSES